MSASFEIFMNVKMATRINSADTADTITVNHGAGFDTVRSPVSLTSRTVVRKKKSVTSQSRIIP